MAVKVPWPLVRIRHMVSSYQLAWLNWIVKLRGTKEREAATVIQTSSCRVPNETSQAGCMTNPKTAAFCHMCFSHYVIFGSKTTYIGKYTHPMGIIFASLEVETIKNVNIPHWDHHLGPPSFRFPLRTPKGKPSPPFHPYVDHPSVKDITQSVGTVNPLGAVTLGNVSPLAVWFPINWKPLKTQQSQLQENKMVHYDYVFQGYTSL